MTVSKRTVTGVILLLLAAMVAACNYGSNASITNDQNIVTQQQQIYQKAQPVPLYDFSEQRNTLLQIYNAKNEARQTWAIFESWTGEPVYPYVCPSIGLPIPADTQLTNPDQLTRVQIPNSNGGGSGNYVDGVVPQAEPDGLYSSRNTDATYVICIRNGGKPELIYTEQKVTSVSHEVTYDPTTKTFIDSGKDPTIVISVVGGNSSSPTPSK